MGGGQGSEEAPGLSPAQQSPLGELAVTLPPCEASGKHVSTFLENYLFCRWHPRHFPQPFLATCCARLVHPGQVVVVHPGPQAPVSLGHSGFWLPENKTALFPVCAPKGLESSVCWYELCPCPKFTLKNCPLGLRMGKRVPAGVVS